MIRQTLARFACLVLLAAPAAAEPEPRTFLLDPALLARSRRRLAFGDAALAPALARLRADADAALAAGPFTVVDPPTPPSGDRHDYMSLSIYWWPDPGKPGGLPWIHRDGETNPEHRKYDLPRISGMAGAVHTLALAWWLTRHEPYAARAALLLRTWFLDPATRMNPNLNFAQGVPGRDPGNRQGVIEGAVLATYVVDAAGLLAGSRAWTAGDQRGLVDWFRRFGEWLSTSPLGRQERTRPNNHGTWYDVQAAAGALFCGRPEAAREAVLRWARLRHLQIAPDGAMTFELYRTKSWSYCLYNLDALLALVSLGRRVGVDLWHGTGAPEAARAAARARLALDYLVRHADPAVRWPHRQIEPVDRRASLAPYLRRVAVELGDRRHAAILAEMAPLDRADRFRLLYGDPP